MPVSLLLDSSDKNLAVGFAKDGKVICSVCYPAWQRQSELMVFEIDRLMKENNIDRKDIAEIVAAKGPGSYTGVRIAMSIAKVMAMALDIPLYLVSSLDILNNPAKPSLCVVNARSKRSYVGLYGEGGALQEDAIWENAEVTKFIQAHSEFSVCGDASYLGVEGEQHDVLVNLALCKDEAHRVENVLAANPVYLKDSYDKGKFKTVVRKMMPSDLSPVVELEKECFSNPLEEKDIRYEANENPVAYLYVAVVDHEVVGYIDFYVTFNSATIARIAVKEKFRRKGIAQMLLSQMDKDLESKEDFVEYCTLEVRVSNNAARKLYLKNHFEEVVMKKAYYDDGEDAVYMVRSYVHD